MGVYSYFVVYLILCVFSFYLMLKFFVNGYFIDYDGFYSVNVLVLYVRCLIVFVIEVYIFEFCFWDFLKIYGFELFIFVGFGLEVFVLEKLVYKYRNKGWFIVLGEYFEKVYEDFKFDERYVLVVLCGEDEV